MAKKSIMMAAAIGMISIATASPIDKKDALAAARSFFTNTIGAKNGSDLAIMSEGWSYEQIYLVGNEGGGFVVVSANDVARPILAYSTTNRIAPQHIGENLKYLLDNYEEEIAQASQRDLPSDPQWETLLKGGRLVPDTKDGETDSIGPLMTTKWGQYSPYNGLCPSGVPSGCVSISTGQIMKYWNYPAFGEGQHTYNSNSYGPLSADFAHTRYDWDNMPNVGNGSSSSAQRTALATMIYHVGVAVNMDYNTMESGALNGAFNENSYTAHSALMNFFRYSKEGCEYRTQGSTSNEEWTEMLVEEIRALRPVLYGGASAAGGHSFVCDGVDSRRYMHFNLGENGEGDGWYAVGAIQYGAYNFSSANDAVIGIRPEYGIYTCDTVLSIGKAGGDLSTWLSASDPTVQGWNGVSKVEWITLTDTSFERLGEVKMVVAANNTGAERSGKIVFTQGAKSTTLTVSQAAYDESDYCSLTVKMENTHNTSWLDDAHISFESPNGLVYATARHTTAGGSSTATVMVAPHDVVVRWVKGGYNDRYCNYSIENQHGETILEVNNAYYNGKDNLIVWPCVPMSIEQTTDEMIGLTVDGSILTAKSSNGIDKMELVDVVGRTLTTVKGNKIDISHLPTGLYMLRLSMEDGTMAVRKVVL